MTTKTTSNTTFKTFDLTQNYFELFDLPVQFELDVNELGKRYRKLQASSHPDRFLQQQAKQQTKALQYSSFVNQAYTTLRMPLTRAMYLLKLQDLDEETITRHQLPADFLMQQMEWREQLEELSVGLKEQSDIESQLENLMKDLRAETIALAAAFAAAHESQDTEAAMIACVKMQYFQKLIAEAEELEAALD